MPEVQTDNSDLEAKVMIRRVGLYMLGSPETVEVLDLYAGAGVMRDAVYQDVGRYLGVDRKDCGRPEMLLGDNRRLLPGILRRHDGWNFYDCDAYDNPWILVCDICRLARPGRFVTIATCGLGRALKNGHSNAFIRQVTGTRELSDLRLLYRWYDSVIIWVLERPKKSGCKPLHVKRMRSILNADVYYYSILWRKG